MLSENVTPILTAKQTKTGSRIDTKIRNMYMLLHYPVSQKTGHPTVAYNLAKC